MRYQISHSVTYLYDRAVLLEPHILRLRSRCDATQFVHSFSLDIFPEPAGISQVVDLDGNSIVKVWFIDPTDRLEIIAKNDVETYRNNPFDYLLEPWAVTLPIDYSMSWFSKLQPYLQSNSISMFVDPGVAALAQEVGDAVDGQVSAFLYHLNQRIYENCKYQVRDDGAPLSPAVTWNQKGGSCRDLTVLFMAVCRSVGLAARFVSGYQEGDRVQAERHLHAWAEVYLPGGGWRGYDPTLGLAVSDSHVALVASSFPVDTIPVSGGFRGPGVQARMMFDILINKSGE